MSTEDSDDLSILDDFQRDSRSSAETWNRRVASLVTLALVGTLAWHGAAISWRIALPDRTPFTNAPKQLDVAGPTASDRRAQDLDTIIASHLFGRVKVAVAEPEAPPETPLDLRLRGIVYSDVSADARAIIADPSGPQFAYAVGDSVPGDAQIVQIRRALVVLERNGLRETLRLEQHKRKSSKPGAAPTPDRRYDERGNYALAKTLGGFQARLKTDPASAMSLLRIVLERNGTAVIGVRLYPGPERGFLERIALEPGDLVTHVNAIPIDSTASGLEALRALTASDELTLQVTRGDRRLAFSFTIAQ
jgi:general secretion pathway protein C